MSKLKHELRQAKIWKIRLSHIIFFAKTEKPSDVNYHARNPHWRNQPAMTQTRALAECVSRLAFVTLVDARQEEPLELNAKYWEGRNQHQ